MQNKTYTLFTAVLLGLMIFILSGCSGSGTAANGAGSVTAKLVWDGSGAVAKMVASAPTGVTTVRLAMSGTGMATVQQDFAAGLGSGTLNDIPAGGGYTFTAYGLDASGKTIYVGSKSNLTITAGQNTDVGTITMVAVSGSAFTTPMLSGKTFTYSFPNNGSTMTGSITFKADNTVTKTDSNGTLNGTWTINSSGKLVTTFSSEVDTLTLISSNPPVFTATIAWQNGSIRAAQR